MTSYVQISEINFNTNVTFLYHLSLTIVTTLIIYKLQKMKKLLIYPIVLLFSILSFSQQNFQGQATYQSKTTMDMSRFDKLKMSDQQKKMILERMKHMFEKTYILTFNKSESIYKEQEKLTTPGKNSAGISFMSSFSNGKLYKNIKEKQLIEDKEFFGKQFLITDSIPKLKWKMTNETKQIGKYLCMKATAIKPINKMDFKKMRRKKKKDTETTNKKKDSSVTKSFMDDVDIPKEVEVTAWYTMQIPVSNGPEEYSGLPGLILEVNEGRTTILCSKIVLNPTEKEAIEAPKKGKKVTRKEYNDIMMKKIQEMREMYGGRGRKSGVIMH